ncbi:hypothetical protein NSA47_02280 [Irregularibacter muris]|uniref:DUF6673 domain-containing protein n=1 Tax=Irregularibacter muris TaxID=1796619 RepID=A0AAE3HE59_9FIRM|nr:DUF6673 family protein [Irregularibacter muris]MCR1897815.1 hypothetical protein [Irregularibacter muris]
MAKRFEFKNNNLKLDISGHLFEFDTTNPELVKRVLTFSEDAQKLSNELTKREDYVVALEETIEFCIKTLDSILGEGASKKIFVGREVGLFDCLDIINYLMDEVKADRDTKFQAYSPNRPQRRAKK